jgi:hypothetical protein
VSPIALRIVVKHYGYATRVIAVVLIDNTAIEEHFAVPATKLDAFVSERFARLFDLALRCGVRFSCCIEHHGKLEHLPSGVQ